MFHVETPAKNIFFARLLTPREQDDADNFFSFLHSLEEHDTFFLIFESQGEARFSGDNKKRMTKWFKENKPMLAKSCLGFARIKPELSPLSRLTSKAMRLAMPCPYEVFTNLNDALSWANRLDKGSK